MSFDLGKDQGGGKASRVGLDIRKFGFEGINSGGNNHIGMRRVPVC